MTKYEFKAELEELIRSFINDDNNRYIENNNRYKDTNNKVIVNYFSLRIE